MPTVRRVAPRASRRFEYGRTVGAVREPSLIRTASTFPYNPSSCTRKTTPDLPTPDVEGSFHHPPVLPREPRRGRGRNAWAGAGAEGAWSRALRPGRQAHGSP